MRQGTRRKHAKAVERALPGTTVLSTTKGYAGIDIVTTVLILIAVTAALFFAILFLTGVVFLPGWLLVVVFVSVVHKPRFVAMTNMGLVAYQPRMFRAAKIWGRTVGVNTPSAREAKRRRYDVGSERIWLTDDALSELERPL
jgi:hypothetical protein